jgi:hypothetical protein
METKKKLLPSIKNTIQGLDFGLWSKCYILVLLGPAAPGMEGVYANSSITQVNVLPIL